MNKFLVLEGRKFLDMQATEGLVQQPFGKMAGLRVPKTILWVIKL
jgi:hypothetical protein